MKARQYARRSRFDQSALLAFVFWGLQCSLLASAMHRERVASCPLGFDSAQPADTALAY
jgi:hypothetical protein